MSAYLVARLAVTSTDWVEEYSEKVEALIQKHGGHYLVRAGQQEHVEQALPTPDAVVIIEFPDSEKAKAFYADPDYAPLITLRKTGSNADILIHDGV